MEGASGEGRDEAAEQAAIAKDLAEYEEDTDDRVEGSASGAAAMSDEGDEGGEGGEGEEDGASGGKKGSGNGSAAGAAGSSAAMDGDNDEDEISPRIHTPPPVLMPQHEAAWAAVHGVQPGSSLLAGGGGGAGATKGASSQPRNTVQSLHGSRNQAPAARVVPQQPGMLSAEQATLLDTIAAAVQAPSSPAARAVVTLCRTDAGLGLCLGHIV